MKFRSTGHFTHLDAFLADLCASTRKDHRALNRLIILRLPLCLPPNADNPLVYARGIVLFGQIYYVFEQILKRGVSDNLLNIHYQRCLPYLLRTDRLKDDIHCMKPRFGSDAADELDSLASEAYTFRSRIASAIAAKPHVILAYTWIMYLALFNGGQWIQKQLKSAGTGFWHDQEFPISFFAFEEGFAPGCGKEGLEACLKEGFLSAASVLTDTERDDVIHEAKHIFSLCSEMIHFWTNEQYNNY